MGLSYFWFIAAAVIGAMDLYFGNAFLLVISAAAFTTALFSFFLSSVYLQVAIFTVISLLVISYLMLLQRHLREVDFYSEILRRHIGKTEFQDFFLSVVLHIASAPSSLQSIGRELLRSEYTWLTCTSAL